MSPPRVGPANGNDPVIIRAAPFTFRTFHGDEIRWNALQRFYCPDRLITLSLAAIGGLYHNEPATREIAL